MSKRGDFYTNKIALVTGAGSGIGRSIANLLDQYGARVHCVDINLAAATAVAQQLRNARAHAVDVSDASAMKDLADSLYADEGRLDLLFNNAGIGHAGFMVDTELHEWRKLIDINVMGVVNGIHAFLPRMLRQSMPAHIVNTASGAGLFPHPRMAPYVATKHAIVGLSTSLAAELEGSNVRVTILCPGIINTAISKNIVMSGETGGHKTQAMQFYEKNGSSPDKVAIDLLSDIRKHKLFCLSPRSQVGLGWFLYRLSPRLAIKVMRSQINKVLGIQ